MPEGLTGGIEPQGVGTLIEDGRGVEWVRALPCGGPAPWRRLGNDGEPWAVWSAIPEPTYVLTTPT